jgi:hypothetical protein
MDPTATLSEIRHLIQAWQSGNTADPAFYADELTTHMQNLDEWITKGGHLPTPGRPPRPSARCGVAAPSHIPRTEGSDHE